MTALSASKSTLRCGRMPKPVSHASRNAGKLPVSCWLRNTRVGGTAAAPRLAQLLADERQARVPIDAFQAPLSFTIGPRRRSGL